MSATMVDAPVTTLLRCCAVAVTASMGAAIGPVETWSTAAGRRSLLSGQLVLRKDGEVLPLRDTRVTFPSGGLTAAAGVLAVVDLENSGRTGIVTDVSPFHPVDPAWPDQGADVGVVAFAGEEVDVVDTILGATSGANLLHGANIPVRRGEPGWAFLVIHLLPAGGPLPAVGQQVELRVDAAQRAAVSLGHTACHLAALALDAALAGRWRKPVALDGLGRPNFDAAALQSSRIRPLGAVDIYRIGKSLRKKGFDAEALDPVEVAAAANAVLAGWVAAGASITVEAEGPGLTDRRTWVCRLPEGTERIPCGGTHPTSLVGVGAIDVRLTLVDAELRMETNVTRS